MDDRAKLKQLKLARDGFDKELEPFHYFIIHSTWRDKKPDRFDKNFDKIMNKRADVINQIIELEKRIPPESTPIFLKILDSIMWGLVSSTVGLLVMVILAAYFKFSERWIIYGGILFGVIGAYVRYIYIY